MESVDPTLIAILIFAIASGYGLWYRQSRGKVKRSSRGDSGALTSAVIGQELGTRASLLQFSSAFCTPCRATRVLITDVIQGLEGVAHIDIDAESHLELVRKLDIRSTPTTLFLDRNGIEKGRAIGAPKRAQLLEAIDALLI
ncbi:MAG: thioredoxin family protein [Actinomycetota bacterium]|nr:thioredoxin family protein [Actinomycetota bacterium]